jgi:hypothetical protein
MYCLLIIQQDYQGITKYVLKERQHLLQKLATNPARRLGKTFASLGKETNTILFPYDVYMQA